MSESVKNVQGWIFAHRTFFCSSLLGARLPRPRWESGCSREPTGAESSINTPSAAAKPAAGNSGGVCAAGQTGDGPTSPVSVRAAGLASLVPAAMEGVGCCGGTLTDPEAAATP